MSGKVYINGSNIYTTWKMFLEDGAFNNLMLPAPMKDYIENNSRLAHGEEILDTAVKIDKRDIKIVFCFNTTESNIYALYSSFVNTLQSGKISLYVEDLGITFYLYYRKSTDFNSINGFAKLAVTFTEPNPTNRLIDE